MEDSEYRLDGIIVGDINLPKENSIKWNKFSIILIIIIIFHFLIIIAGILVYFLALKKDGDEDTNAFIIYPEIKTSENNLI